ncbi:phosphonate C-P lyase system protein PhnL [Scleromatobacter humisilvae]|uniref:Phosphonate C-P lyase system protein PhnL n=1 Tax=Scleromatobacter humisilvae TaxID=2897159 RepID=A0A9X1YJC5_9BURK|nr:phosphonate C-P lyase system protein PhnL [Scleromatobacter humisilvae]MCK9686757.1 phosphonate C-P lyase system protein PhnL [Scleromatobacter humisilvae]
MNLDTSPRLSVRGLAKHFTLHLRGGARLQVLEDTSLDIGAGECVALVGASGRGKSTLMKCLFGSYGADAGALRFESSAGPVDLATASPQRMIELRRRDIAYVSQFLRAVPRVPALDVVAQRLVDAEPVPAADDLDDAGHEERLEAARDAARALLARLNLPPALWDLPPATFSGGEQQRVNIARGFVQASRLLLLDEPTASLDAANRRVVVELIHEAKARGAAVVGIFHDEEVRDAVADRCVELG